MISRMKCEVEMKKFVWAVMALCLLVSCSHMKKNQMVSQNKMNDKTPFLTSPKVRKVWVPEKIEGDKFIEGHWMWVLERTTTWSQ